MTFFQTLKANSKHALQGNWLRAAAAPLILAVCWAVLSLIRQYTLDLLVAYPGYSFSEPRLSLSEMLLHRASSLETLILAVFLLLVILLSTPLLLGVMRWHYQLVQGKPQALAEIFIFFESFRRYCKAVWLFITVFVRSLLWSFLFTALPSAMLILSVNMVNGRISFLAENAGASSTIGAMGLTISIILLILSVILYAVFMNRYTLTFYLFFDDPEEGISSLIKTSISYSKSYRFNMLSFSLSFFGWFLICLLIIPVFYVMPYYMASVTMYSRYLIEKRRREASERTREFAVEELEPALWLEPRSENEPSSPHDCPETLPPEPPDSTFPINTAYPPREPDPPELAVPEPASDPAPSPEESDNHTG